MGEIFLFIMGIILLISGSGAFLASVFFSFLSILLYRITRNRYWEAKAGFFGLLALGALPLGGLGGALLLFRKLYYGLSFSWNQPYLFIPCGVYFVILLIVGIYLLWKSPIRLD